MPIPAETRIPGTYSSAVPVTPADGVTFATARALYIGTGGNLVAQTSDGNAIILLSVANGKLLPVRVNAVAFTGTTAANILALY